MEMIAVDNSGSYKVNTLYKSFDIDVVPAITFGKEGKSRSNSHQLIKAPMPGRIVKIKVKEGDRVTEGTPLVVLSAMKMENELRSEGDGIVHKISIKEDEVVKDKQLLIDIKEIDKTE
jgi:biotin carboxyl carrier protein